MVKPYIFIENNADIAIATHFDTIVRAQTKEEWLERENDNQVEQY